MSVHRGKLLDVGAGDGNVTVELKPLFDDVLATEVSAPAIWQLRGHGIPCSERPSYASLEHRFWACITQHVRVCVCVWVGDLVVAACLALPVRADELEGAITTVKIGSLDPLAGQYYDTVACLNVLDRCSHPMVSFQRRDKCFAR